MNTPKNAGQPFATQDDQIIREMLVERASVKAIAEKLERTEAGITARLERLGLKASRVLAKQTALVG